MNGRERSLARSIRGPITLVTLGVLFAINNFTPYRFEQTWPVILIVFGLLSLLGRGMDPVPPAPPPPPQGYPVGTGYPPAGNYAQGSYSQSPYAAPAANAAGPAKGGFGTTAPRPGDAGTEPQGGSV